MKSITHKHSIVTLLFFCCCSLLSKSLNSDPFDLPLLPDKFSTFDFAEFASNFTYATKTNPAVNIIPRNVWIAFKTKPESIDDLDDELRGMIIKARNDGWNVYCLGHNEQMRFVEKYYPNTALLKAIKLIHPLAGAMVSDIFRVAAVYAFGGFYMDDDSVIGESLEKIVQANDSMIIATEKSLYHDERCYRRHIFLSGTAMKIKYHIDDFKHVFGGKQVVQWAFFAAPQHKVMRQILANIVYLVRSEYLGSLAVYRLTREPPWKTIVCTTGPDVWTATLYDMQLNHQFTSEQELRVLGGYSFLQYQGYFKVASAKHYIKRKESHYYHTIVRDAQVLSEYAPFNKTRYEGMPISDGGHSIWLLQDGKLRPFPDYDTFSAMNFSHVDTFILSNRTCFDSLPKGDTLPKLGS